MLVPSAFLPLLGRFFLVFAITFGFSVASAETIINAGHDGDFYHNADELHTRLSNPETDHPGLTLLTPTRGAVSYVTAGRVIGNASLAYHHPWTGSSNLVSIMRYWFMNSQSYANVAYNQYRGNNAYWYPEHRDHDARDNHHAMTPCVTNSQGSSGSEMDEVKKFLWTLAAFQSDTKQTLSDNGLLMPTVQMIMRRTRVADDAEYLTGKAHQNAYNNYSNADAMKLMAAAMPADSVPPMVQLDVIDDTFTGVRGKDILQYSTNQRLYETPVSVSRLWKNLNYTNKIILSAENSFDINGRSLSYHWSIIRGDPAHVRITPQNAEGSVVEIEIDYHPETVIEGTTIKTNVVSVGAFVHNGVYYSAPGFVTSYTMPSEVRNYDQASGRLLDVSYIDRTAQELMPNINGYPQGWEKDVFHYDGDGKLSGWTRTDQGADYEFTPEGYQVITSDGDGKPELVQEVSYSTDWSGTLPRSKWVLSGEPFLYESGGKDTEDPSTPTNLLASSLTKDSFRLSWDASSDNIAVAGYRLDVALDNQFNTLLDNYRNLDLGGITTKIILGLNPSTQYFARVRAYDHSGNISDYSATLSTTTSDGASEDDDKDGVLNGSDCAPLDASRWRNKAYPDEDQDGIRENAVLITFVCFGSTLPAKATLSENGPDNCPTMQNGDQKDFDKDKIGDVCDDNRDGDARKNSEDCAPLDPDAWRTIAYLDADKDGVRETSKEQSVACYGQSPAQGFTSTENGPDNCPKTANSSQQDSDGDGIGDACDVPDPEPRKDPLTITGVWNGYQEQINVVECSSGSSESMVMTLSVIDSQTNLVGERSIELAGYGTTHSILNDYEIVNLYGTYAVSLEATEDAARLVRCRTLFYRHAVENDERQLEYVYAIPAGGLLSGTSSGLYNSMNPEGPDGLPVFNWLSVFNPGDKPLSASVEVYTHDGDLDAERSYRIENLARGDRQDSALGHPAGKTTGMYRIVPDDPEQLYGAFLNRYSRRDAQTFNFAFSLLAKKGLNDSGPVSASTMGPALNWGEIANLSSAEAEVEIEVFSREKVKLFSETRRIVAGAQYHLFLNEHLGEWAVGYFRVRVLSGGSNEGTLLVQSLYYGYAPAQAGRIAWSYASQASSSASSDVRGLAVPINTFYQAANWLKLFNPTEEEVEVGISIYAMNGDEISSRNDRITLVGSADIALHEEVGPNFAGMVRLESALSIQAEVLRVLPLKEAGSTETGYITNIVP